MKKYEWSNKNNNVRKCIRCGRELRFADMTCSYCGADVRTEQRTYKPKLVSSDIQTTPKERVGAPEQPQKKYGFEGINIIRIVLIIWAVIFSVCAAIYIGNKMNMLMAGIICGELIAAVLITLTCALDIALRNTAKAAENNERAALGIEYQIQQMNEFITSYNKDKEVESENAEVFAKLIAKIGKLEEAQNSALGELKEAVDALSESMTAYNDYDYDEEAEDIQEEENQCAEAETEKEKAVEIATEPVIEEEEENKETYAEEENIEEPEEIEEEIEEQIEEEDIEDDTKTYDARSAAEEWDEEEPEEEIKPSRLDAFLDDDD